ncbi:MAG: sugar phosphate isomerase/epimerase family protein [Sphaerochaetaceae bacterium]
MMQFGLRAHDFGKLPAAALAETLGRYSPDSIQLALSKALLDAPLGGGLSPGYARRIQNLFAAQHIGIAVLGCYFNPVHPDPQVRETALRRFEEHLRFARDFGCAIVGTETGSCNADGSFHPDTASEKTFDTLVASLERLVKTAEACGSIIGIEPVAEQHTLSSVEKTARLLQRIDSPCIQVIYDPVNLLPWDGLPEADGRILPVPSVNAQRRFFEQAFSTFGDRIVAVHLKDFQYRGKRKTGDLPALSGDLDTGGLLSLLNQRKPYIDVLLENSSPVTVQSTLATLRRLATEQSTHA